LDKVERLRADTAARKKEATCNCSTWTLADSDRPEQFEAEMNLPCPAHGFRQLGYIHRRGSSNWDREKKIIKMLKTYEAGLEQAKREGKYGPQTI